jgi:hypothetical protein
MLCNMSVVIVHSMVTWFGNWREFLPAARSSVSDLETLTADFDHSICQHRGRGLFTNGMPLARPGFSRRWIPHAS